MGVKNVNDDGDDDDDDDDDLSEAGGRSPGSTTSLDIGNDIYFGGYKGNHSYPYVQHTHWDSYDEMTCQLISPSV